MNEGYGVIGKRKAHRVFYEQAHGPIASGVDLHHLCHNTPCVNPDHLEPIKHGHHVRLHQGISADIADEVRRATGSQREIAARLGVSKTTVARIQSGTWHPD
jgi:hypothetical protein